MVRFSASASAADVSVRHYERCVLCEHRCAVNRLAGERGVCKAGPIARVFRHRVECGEEPELVPSHLFYLSGCDLRCVFCIAEANAFDPGAPGHTNPVWRRLCERAADWFSLQCG